MNGKLETYLLSNYREESIPTHHLASNLLTVFCPNFSHLFIALLEIVIIISIHKYLKNTGFTYNLKHPHSFSTIPTSCQSLLKFSTPIPLSKRQQEGGKEHLLNTPLHDLNLPSNLWNHDIISTLQTNCVI